MVRGGGGEKPDHLHFLFNILRSLSAKNRPGVKVPGCILLKCKGVKCESSHFPGADSGVRGSGIENSRVAFY